MRNPVKIGGQQEQTVIFKYYRPGHTPEIDGCNTGKDQQLGCQIPGQPRVFVSIFSGHALSRSSLILLNIRRTSRGDVIIFD